MPRREPPTETIKASEARAQWSQILNSVFRRERRVIVEKSGIPVAAIISAEDLALLRRLEEERERDFAVIDETRAAFKGIPQEELDREVKRAVAAVRAEMRAERKQAEAAAHAS